MVHSEIKEYWEEEEEELLHAELMTEEHRNWRGNRSANPGGYA